MPQDLEAAPPAARGSGAAPILSEHLRLAPPLAAALRAGARVAVIGASGWLGGAALAMLDRALDRDAFADDAFADRVLAFGSRPRLLALPSGRQLACRGLDALDGLGDAAILHFAYLMRDRAEAIGADGYVAANAAIQSRIVEAVRRQRPRGLFFASSGAVYGRDGGERPTAERDLYGWMKREHERQFEALAGPTAVVNGRIFSVAGEFINRPETYALASMLVALREGSPVRLRSAREAWRSYAYVGDIVNLALALLLGRRSETRLDIAGGEAVEIGRLAALCAAVTGRAEATIERPPPSGEPPDRMIGDPVRYHALLAEEGLAPLPLEEQVRATALYLGALRGA